MIEGDTLELERLLRAVVEIAGRGAAAWRRRCPCAFAPTRGGLKIVASRSNAGADLERFLASVDHRHL